MQRHRLLTSIAVMSATVMQVIDTTIVNVALPQMQGQLGATPDQISWVLTSYLVASAIVMMLTGYLTDRLGQRRLLIASIAGFTITSALCGIANSLEEMVAFRLLQGIFGAALVPLSQSIMLQIFPQEERGRAMAIWGVGVMVGPILGPTLGGWLTDAASWRWTFFINLPVGIFSALLTWRVVANSPLRERRMDWWGLAYLIVTISGAQFVLDRGSQLDWFSSTQIQIAATLSILSLLAYVWHSLQMREHAIINPLIFRDRNFATSSLLLAIFGLGLFGTLMLQPLMLANLFAYPALTIGFALAPRGIASMISMMVVGRIIRRVDPRLLIASGITIFTFGSYLTTQYSLNIDIFWIVVPAIIQGFGLGLVFVPLSTVAFSTLEPRFAAEAAGVYSVLRTIGSAIGISIVAKVLTDHAQIAWNQLGGALHEGNPALRDYLAQAQLGIHAPSVAPLLATELGRQSQMLGILDAFFLVTWSFAAMLPLLLVLRLPKKTGAAAAPGKG
ncbi:MAG: DHA2 family efflux MFS transporter permease subunit [Gammaproteobacteria bacterium]|nr:DHA2 family efflux MFS transporter permease subunit [Gammaproteobacteria bacterium]